MLFSYTQYVFLELNPLVRTLTSCTAMVRVDWQLYCKIFRLHILMRPNFHGWFGCSMMAKGIFVKLRCLPITNHSLTGEMDILFKKYLTQGQLFHWSLYFVSCCLQVLSSLLESPYFFLDVLYVHELPSEVNLCKVSDRVLFWQDSPGCRVPVNKLCMREALLPCAKRSLEKPCVKISPMILTCWALHQAKLLTLFNPFFSVS